MPERMPEWMPEYMSDRTPDRMSKNMSDRMSVGGGSLEESNLRHGAVTELSGQSEATVEDLASSNSTNHT